MTKAQAFEDSFVLTYDSLDDPSNDEVAAVLRKLKPLPARTVVPGTIRVSGPRKTIEQVVKSLDHWRLSSEQRLRSTPPSKSLLKHAE